MQIGDYPIGPGHPPFIVAEISANHGGSLDVAFELIETAKLIGADAVKMQCYEPDDITIDCDRTDFIMAKGPWEGRKLWDLYSKAQTPLSWFPKLAEHASKVGITWFSSVFSKRTVDLCASLDMPAYKIASCEITDTPLIRYAASKGRTMIISTGMASDREILQAQACCGSILLHCVSGYPSKTEEANLTRISHLRDTYGLKYIGLSDHSFGLEVPIAATALGACVIEKHLRTHVISEDAEFSLWPNEFGQMVQAVKRTWAAMQPSQAASEEPQRQARRSLYVVQDMKAGDPFTETNVRSIRPAYGLPPKILPDVIGKEAARNIERGTSLAQDMIALAKRIDGAPGEFL